MLVSKKVQNGPKKSDILYGWPLTLAARLSAPYTNKNGTTQCAQVGSDLKNFLFRKKHVFDSRIYVQSSTKAMVKELIYEAK